MTTPSDMIATVRTDLRDAIQAGAGDARVYLSPPSPFYGPAILITEGSPFIEAGDTTGAAVFAFEVLILVDVKSDAAVMIADLDRRVSAVLEALWHEYAVTVGPYETFTFANNQPFLGARLSVASDGWKII